MTNEFVKAQFLAKKDGIYTVYVFQNLETKEYIMCTKLPNWEYVNIKLFSEGFLEIENAIAGEKYFNPKIGTFDTYKYTKVYFKNFIIEDKQKIEEIKIV